ncbi:MAG: hypothetical protein IKG34_10145 [Solobacterium sp.]|nr:hypothetical protein [Solobacterium sp.]
MDIRNELKNLRTTLSDIDALEECAEEYDKIFGAGNAISENCRQQRIRKVKHYNAIIRYIDSIPDEEIRSIIRLRYQKRDPYTWGMVNAKVYGYNDSSYSRKRLERYFASHAEDLDDLISKMDQEDDNS